MKEKRGNGKTQDVLKNDEKKGRTRNVNKKVTFPKTVKLRKREEM